MPAGEVIWWILRMIFDGFAVGGHAPPGTGRLPDSGDIPGTVTGGTNLEAHPGRKMHRGADSCARCTLWLV